MPHASSYVFYGDQQHKPEKCFQDPPLPSEPYVASAELIQAVNLAIYLRRPLLLEGEAGCGKTRVAYAIAYEMGLPIHVWPVRSTSTVQEGLYTYDAVLRLHDVHTSRLEMQQPAAVSAPRRRDPGQPADYCKLGALGEAFNAQHCPAVLLIDEIDKADIDFPNDLLTVLDDPWKFDIPETYETISARHRPIVIITSNKEKGNLPAPFLRRCLYHFIEFPNAEQLKKMIEVHSRVRCTPPPAPELVETATQRFLALRDEGGLYKKPGTSEFLDWLEALQNFSAPSGTPVQLASQGPIPYPELLFKLRADRQRMQ